MTRFHRFGRLGGVILPLGLIITITCLTPAPAPAQSLHNPQSTTTLQNQTNNPLVEPSITPDEVRTNRNVISPSLSDRQKLSIMHANFKKSKSDAAELAELAKGLHEELDKPNANILSADVINRLDKIERLAKKIREETKGF